MTHWTLDQIPWSKFDRSKVDPEIVKLVKAAALVEFNGGAYAIYLGRVFGDDAQFRAAAETWAKAGIQVVQDRCLLVEHRLASRRR